MNSKVLIMIVITASVALWDINTRLAWDTHTATEQQSKSAMQVQVPQKLNAAGQEALLQQYQSYNGEEPNVATAAIEGMSLTEQNLQSGRLDQLFSGDLLMRLSAVIRQPRAGKPSESQIFALLSLQNIKKNQTTLEKIQPNEQFYGYKVQDIQLDHISLHSLNDISRVITLPIYQKRSSASSEPTLNRKSL
ncbi:MAG: hypothetical protein ACJASL_002440 [Paraglaciecola sp.]|jgi:hypothetical protein